MKIHKQAHAALLLPLCLLGLGLGACGDMFTDTPTQYLKPESFVQDNGPGIDPLNPDTTDTRTETAPSTQPGSETFTDTTDPSTDPATDPTTDPTIGTGDETNSEPRKITGDVNQLYLTDGMVGHISGRPVFADNIFDKIGVNTLRRLGAEQGEADFNKQVGDLLLQILNAELEESLLLDEAERELNDFKKQGLEFVLKAERERLINQYGRGSVSDADRNMKRQLGRNLAEQLEFQRQRLLVQDLLQNRIWARIQVSRRDTLRYYDENPEEFNPDPVVKYRLLLLRSPSEIAQARGALESGENLESLIKLFRPDQDQITEVKTPLAEFDQFGFPELNEAIKKLKPGEVSPLVMVGPRKNIGTWVELVEVQEAKSLTYEQAYLDIVNKIRYNRYLLLYEKLQNDLKYEGSFSDPKVMTRRLLDIAKTRYSAR